MALRRGSAEGFERFRKTGWESVSSEAARLAGVGVRQPEFQHEGNASPDGDLRNVQAGFRSRPGAYGGQHQSRSERHVSLALPSAAAASGTGMGFHHVGGGEPGPGGWRPLL